MTFSDRGTMSKAEHLQLIINISRPFYESVDLERKKFRILLSAVSQGVRRKELFLWSEEFYTFKGLFSWLHLFYLSFVILAAFRHYIHRLNGVVEVLCYFCRVTLFSVSFKLFS